MTTTAIPPFIPDNAPFSKEQIAWLNGFLAGAYSGSSDGGDETSHTEVEKTPVTILWGSQTGNCEGLARQLSKKLAGNGCEPKVADMDEYDGSALASEQNVLIVTSTYGDGDPPDNAAGLHEWLHGSEAPRLDGLRYSVLALGDSNYPEFCKCGIEFDSRLEALGAKRMAPRVDCDVDFDDGFDSWSAAVSEALAASMADEAIPTGLAEASEKIDYGKKNPFPAKVLENRNLNREGSAKETRHVALSIEGSGFSYEPGDALAIVPENCPEYARELIEILGFQEDDLVELAGAGSTRLAEALRTQVDITNLSAKALKAIGESAGCEAIRTLGEDRAALKEYGLGRQLIDLLVERRPRFDSAQAFVSALPKLAPRLYSISSSPKAHPNEVHVTVGVVRYESEGRPRKGVCSTFLAEHDGERPVKVYFHESKAFKLPEDDNAPIVMVGPGTGIAPFRAFLEEREARGARGRNWLFFGDQRTATDFLYQEEIEQRFRDGLLTRFDTAFSRDQEKKLYVQDRMREHGAELYAWLEEGSYFYVCGDASRMANDVNQALKDLLMQQGNMTEKDADAYLARLKKEKRYLRDVY